MLSSFEQLDYNMEPTPQQLLEIYSNGFQGVRFSRADYLALRYSVPRFKDVFHEYTGIGKGKLSLPYKAALALEPEFGRYENQRQGDCVGHGTRNAGMIDYCIDALFGETVYKGRLANENIYGWRGHSGEGADCARLATYVSQNGPGGFLPRAKYSSGNNSVDLTNYNPSVSAAWGRNGTPSWLNEIAAQNKALQVYSLKSVDEAIDAISLGFGISMCSGYGFSSTRNEDGLAEQRGSWSHCFTEDTLITSTVIKKIADINIGDVVIGHDGELHKVTKTFCRDYYGELVCIKANGLPTIKVTPEHPILINRPREVATYVEQKVESSDVIQLVRKRKTEFDTIWIKASDVKLKDRVLIPNNKFTSDEIRLPKFELPQKPQSILHIPKDIDKPNSDLAWLFGLYIADGGYVKNHKICITLGLHELKYAERIRQIINDNFNLNTYIYIKENCIRVTVYSAILANSFHKWFGGSGIDKHVPEFMFYGWDLESLVDGIKCGDGHDHNNNQEIVNTSKILIYQLRYILSILGKCVYFNKSSKTGYSKTHNCKDIYIIGWHDNNNQHKIRHDGYYLTTGIKLITKEKYSGKVYNFEVGDVNSYIADGICVHNCMAHIGIDDTDWAHQKYGGPISLTQNSWGVWNSGPKRHEQPDGSFWIRPKVLEAMIRGGGGWVIASVRGYNRQLVYDTHNKVLEISKD